MDGTKNSVAKDVTKRCLEKHDEIHEKVDDQQAEENGKFERKANLSILVDNLMSVMPTRAVDVGVVALGGGVLHVGRVDRNPTGFFFRSLVDLVVRHRVEIGELLVRKHLMTRRRRRLHQCHQHNSQAVVPRNQSA